MISDRLMQIVIYIKKNERCSYKELAEVLSMKERQVRYDIDRINDTLKEHDRALIQKLPKGVLVYEHGEQISEFFERKLIVFSQEQRINFILLTILFDIEALNLKTLSEVFSVSRSSVKNDLKMAEDILHQHACELSYHSGFQLHGNESSKVELMVQEFSKYVYMYGRKRIKFNAYELFAKKIIRHAFKMIDVKSMITWIKEFLEHQRIVLTDGFFSWYVSSVLTIIWYEIHGNTHPFVPLPEIHTDIHSDVFKKLEEIMHCSLKDSSKYLMVHLLRYTNKESDVEDNHLESYLTCELIARMEEKTNISLGDDDILYKGLLDHMIPLLKRMQDQQYLNIDDNPLLNVKEAYINEQVSDCLKQVKTLKDLREPSEIISIAAHFMGSIARKKIDPKKRILLVSGLGKGITAQLKETLMSEFHIEISDTIPGYKLMFYQKWKHVDLILSTIKFEIDCIRPIVFIHPFLTQEDRQNLIKANIQHRKLLPDFYEIQANLNFLTDGDRKRVMSMLRGTFGYRNVISYRELSSLPNALKLDSISVCEDVQTIERGWERILDSLYIQNMVDEQFNKTYLNTQQAIQNGCLLTFNKHFQNINRSGIYILAYKVPILHKGEKMKMIICIIGEDDAVRTQLLQQWQTLIANAKFEEATINSDKAVDLYKMLLWLKRNSNDTL